MLGLRRARRTLGGATIFRLGGREIKHGIITQFESQRGVFGTGFGDLGKQEIVKLRLEVIDGAADVIPPLLLRT